MSLTVKPPPPSSSVVDLSPRRMLLLLLLVLPPPNLMMTSSPFTVALWRHGNRFSANNICQYLEKPDGGLTVRCSGLRLTQLSSLEAGCFRGLESSLRFLDLSSNWLSALDPAALGGLRAAANLTHNPWHCDCRMQLSMPQLDLDPSSLNEVVCQTSDLPNLGAVGMPLVLLVEDWDLCLSVRRTTDVVMLVTMFLWFSMVISYLVCYIRQNQEDARRHMEYLKSLQSHQV
ncbi:leucine-rich repeat-containing protein 3 isoform X3 [Lates calcarifer]|uniref:Leucine-rich repeat-containing protein 3 isoform X3 n=1 Tax=Lates calcarifer TaxID=8187 RepID=A0AAJ8DMH3_LATCA|nr:leucine-rich repeat-containing protein 3 isoform X3 [Lates calcarifer]